MAGLCLFCHLTDFLSVVFYRPPGYEGQFQPALVESIVFGISHKKQSMAAQDWYIIGGAFYFLLLQPSYWLDSAGYAYQTLFMGLFTIVL